MNDLEQMVNQLVKSPGKLYPAEVEGRCKRGQKLLQAIRQLCEQEYWRGANDERQSKIFSKKVGPV